MFLYRPHHRSQGTDCPGYVDNTDPHGKSPCLAGLGSYGPPNRPVRRCRSIYSKTKTEEEDLHEEKNFLKAYKKRYRNPKGPANSCMIHKHYLLGMKRQHLRIHLEDLDSPTHKRERLDSEISSDPPDECTLSFTNDDISCTNDNSKFEGPPELEKSVCEGPDESPSPPPGHVDSMPDIHRDTNSQLTNETAANNDDHNIKAERSVSGTDVCNNCNSECENSETSERSSLNDSGILSPVSATPPVKPGTEDEADFALDLLRAKVDELRRVKTELERTKKDFAEMKEKGRNDMVEMERKLKKENELKVKQLVTSVREKMSKDVKAAKDGASKAEAKVKAMKKEKEEEIKNVKRLANEQIVAMQKKCEEHVEANKAKSKKEMEDALKAAEERTAKKIESVQRQMQGKIDAAERERRKEVEEIQRASNREIETHQRRADQAAFKYNRLIAEHVVLQGRISDAAKLLNVEEQKGVNMLGHAQRK